MYAVCSWRVAVVSFATALCLAFGWFIVFASDHTPMSATEQEAVVGGWTRGECTPGALGSTCYKAEALCSGANEYCVEQMAPIFCRTELRYANPTRCQNPEALSRCEENSILTVKCYSSQSCHCTSGIISGWTCCQFDTPAIDTPIGKCVVAPLP
jgi:hypothetical protein